MESLRSPREHTYYEIPSSANDDIDCKNWRRATAVHYWVHCTDLYYEKRKEVRREER